MKPLTNKDCNSYMDEYNKSRRQPFNDCSHITVNDLSNANTNSTLGQADISCIKYSTIPGVTTDCSSGVDKKVVTEVNGLFRILVASIPNGMPLPIIDFRISDDCKSCHTYFVGEPSDIFHQVEKNLTDYYIQIDSSLLPRSGYYLVKYSTDCSAGDCIYIFKDGCGTRCCP